MYRFVRFSCTFLFHVRQHQSYAIFQYSIKVTGNRVFYIIFGKQLAWTLEIYKKTIKPNQTETEFLENESGADSSCAERSFSENDITNHVRRNSTEELNDAFIPNTRENSA